ncbi:hypothetical protein BpHYR1_017463 [Brachionus plicatilis]|uniref:Uncharacterized protein n=1 Tax=Brachionus plicatilis TaxID=10195 RepID=A0A3M7SMX2_BRAPC|nr:hypothetical protein BpHYR1_017463 [Brachionus plicatilis]
MVVIFSLFGILIGEGVYVNYVEQEIAYNKCLPYKDLNFCSKSPSFLRAILVTFSDIASKKYYFMDLVNAEKSAMGLTFVLGLETSKKVPQYGSYLSFRNIGMIRLFWPFKERPARVLILIAGLILC